MTEQPAQDPWAAQLTEWLNEAARLRHQFKPPGKDADGTAVREKLQELRQVLDWFETVVRNVTVQKMAAKAQQKALEEQQQDAWDKLADAAFRSPVRRDFEGAEERYARWRLATLVQLQAARAARRRYEFAEQVEFHVRTMYWGLRDIRGELLEILKELQWEVNLER